MLFLEKKKLKLEKQKQKKQTEQFLNQIVLTNLENNNREKDVILFIKCIWENQKGKENDYQKKDISNEVLLDLFSKISADFLLRKQEKLEKLEKNAKRQILLFTDFEIIENTDILLFNQSDNYKNTTYKKKQENQNDT